MTVIAIYHAKQKSLQKLRFIALLLFITILFFITESKHLPVVRDFTKL